MVIHLVAYALFLTEVFAAVFEVVLQRTLWQQRITNSLSVLLAKVKVNLKRIEQARETSLSGTQDTQAPDTGKDASAISEGSFLSLDPPTMSAVLHGEHIPLKAKEYALLDCLYKHHDTIVSKEVLFDEVWGNAFFSDSTLNVHIRKLREKLEEDPNEPKIIRTVWGTGYYLKLKDD